MEWLLLGAGLLCLALSFVLPARRREEGRDFASLPAEEKEAFAAAFLAEYGQSLAGRIDRMGQDSLEQARRDMDLSTNEKMMALEEYGQTLLEQIHKSHQEVVFFYDMLQEKQGALAGLSKETQEKVLESRRHLEAMRHSVALSPAQAPAEPEPAKPRRSRSRKKAEEPPVELSAAAPREAGVEEDVRDGAPGQKRKSAKSKSAKAPEIGAPGGLPSGGKAILGERERTEAVLALRDQGMDEVAIAKQLSMGVGEVRLLCQLRPY